MDSTSPTAARIAGQTSSDSGNLFTPLFAGGMFTLVEKTFVGRRWTCKSGNHHHRTYRDHHHHSADGYGHAS